METTQITIRPAREGDEALLAAIQTESWRQAFAGILKPEVLEPMTDPQRAKEAYHRLLREKTGKGYLLERNGTPQFITWWGPVRDRQEAETAELFCIHSLPDHRREGLGSRMLEFVLQDMRQAGYQKAMLWVFAENQKARRFYEKHGFGAAKEKRISLGAEEIRCEKWL